MIRDLDVGEIDAVAGGPFLFLLVIPAAKLTTAAKVAAVGLGATAGIAGAQAYLEREDN